MKNQKGNKRRREEEKREKKGNESTALRYIKRGGFHSLSLSLPLLLASLIDTLPRYRYPPLIQVQKKGEAVAGGPYLR